MNVVYCSDDFIARLAKALPSSGEEHLAAALLRLAWRSVVRRWLTV